MRRDQKGYECETMITSKHQAYKAWLSRPTCAKRIECEKKRRLTDKLCKKKKRQKSNIYLG